MDTAWIFHGYNIDKYSAIWREYKPEFPCNTIVYIYRALIDQLLAEQ